MADDADFDENEAEDFVSNLVKTKKVVSQDHKFEKSNSRKLLPANKVQQVSEEFQEFLPDQDGTWHRFGVIGDGSCGVHAFFSATSRTYRNLPVKEKMRLRKQLRMSIFEDFEAEDKATKQVRLMAAEKPAKPSETEAIFNKRFKTHLGSTSSWLSYADLMALAKHFHVCMTIVNITKKEEITCLQTEREDDNVAEVVIAADGQHFEVLCVEKDDHFDFLFPCDAFQGYLKKNMAWAKIAHTKTTSPAPQKQKKANRGRVTSIESLEGESLRPSGKEFHPQDLTAAQKKHAKEIDDGILKLKDIGKCFAFTLKYVKALAHARGLVFVHVPLAVMKLLASTAEKDDKSVAKAAEAGKKRGQGKEFVQYVVQVNRLLRDDVLGTAREGQCDESFDEKVINLALARKDEAFEDAAAVLALQVADTDDGLAVRCVGIAMHQVAFPVGPLPACKDQDQFNQSVEDGEVLEIPLVCANAKQGSGRLLLAYVLSKELARKKKGKPKFRGVILPKGDRNTMLGQLAVIFGFTNHNCGYKQHPKTTKRPPRNAPGRMLALLDLTSEKLAKGFVEKMLEVLRFIHDADLLFNVCPAQTGTRVPACM